MNPYRFRILSVCILALALAAGAPAAAETWVERSDANAQILIDVLARQSPEGAGQLGVPGLDEEIFDLKPGFVERSREEIKKAADTLRQRLAAEKDPKVRQDLEILILATDGLTEHGDGAYVTDELPRFLARVQDLPAADIAGQLKESIPAFAAPSDDVTAVVVKRV